MPSHAYPPFQQLHLAFEATVDSSPAAVALSGEGWSLSYLDLNMQANRLAHHLRALGVQAGAVIGLLLPRSRDAVIAALAVLKLGGICVPLDPAYPSSRLHYLLGDAAVSLVISASELAPVLGAPAVARVLLDQAAPQLAQMPAHNPVPLGVPSPLACLFYTSGSTGQPKGVQVPQVGLLNLVFGQTYCDFGPHQVHLMLSSLGFDFSALEIWGALLHGARLAIYEDRFVSLPRLAQSIRSQGVSTLMITPSLLGHLVSERLPDLTGLRQVLVGGDVAPVAAARALLTGVPGCVLVNVYGPTENTVLTTTFTVSSAAEVPNPVPIGRVVEGTQIYVLDDRRVPVAEGEIGELWVGGVGLSPGYVNRAELTAERFVDQPPRLSVLGLHGLGLQAPGAPPADRLYRTGDLARVLPGGELEFLGRSDFQVKVRGHRVELPEVERVICELPAVREAAVLALAPGTVLAPGTLGHGTDTEKRLVGFYTPVPGAALPSGEVRAFLRARLPDYMVPSVLVEVGAFPLTPNGKADRQALSLLAWPADESGTPPGATGAVAGAQGSGPTLSAPELSMQELWTQVLGRRPGPDEDFFLLGGTSLLAALLLSRVADRLGTELPPAVFFARPTVRAMTQWLSERPLRPAQLDPAPANTVLSNSAPINSVSANAGPVQPNPVQLDSVQLDPVQPNPVQPNPVQLDHGPLLLRPGPKNAGTTAPLILIGDPYQYRRMLPQLGSSSAVFSLDCELGGVEAMAKTLTSALLGSSLRAPYRLCGFSFDGLVAYEMARRLREAGEQVEFLGLIDSCTPEIERLTDARLSPGKLILYLGALRRLRDSAWRAFMRNKLTVGGRRLLGLPNQATVDLGYEERYAQMQRYHPGEYPGGLTLYRATAQIHDLFDPLLGWGRLAGGEIRVVAVPGTHMDLIRSDTATRQLGTLLEADLQRA